MSDMAEDFRAMREYRQARNERRRDRASDEFNQASKEAAEAGLTLVRRTDSHYQIKSPAGWMIDFYPGNGRIFRDPKRRVQPPVLRVPNRDDGVSILDVVRAAVDKVGKMEAN